MCPLQHQDAEHRDAEHRDAGCVTSPTIERDVLARQRET
jgi:hypothetical protein